MFLLSLFAMSVAFAPGADLTFTLNASTGSGSMSLLAPQANPPCLQPNCVLFSGALTNTDTDLSFIRLEDISISLSSSNLSLDNTFFAVVPGLLSGDSNYATSGNPANAYSGPIFGIDIAPQTPSGTYNATVTIHASGGTGDPDNNGFTVSKNITITVIPAAQTISFSSLAPVGIPASRLTLNAIASSGLPVTFTSTTPGVCSVSGSALTVLTEGVCSVTASQPGDAVYAAAAPVTQSFTISAASSGGSGPPPGNPLTVFPPSVTIHVISNGVVGSQAVTLSYQTSMQDAPPFTSNFNTNQGTGWLSVSPSSGTMALPAYTASVTISANPKNIAAGTYTGTVNFNSGGGIASVAVTMVVTDAPVPQPTGGIANAASAGQATPSFVSPGSYVAIYGTALAGAGNPSAMSLPLPATLNGASATLCNIPMPLLYASATQINAIVPQAAPSTGSCPLIVISGGVPSAPVPLTLQQLQPGIYTVNLSGSGAGVVANALTGQLNSAANAARAGDFLAIYCTGLGGVQGPNGESGPDDGIAAPLDTLFRTKATITATIGGIDAPVSFAGLTPTFAGLYQVNVKMPQGVPADPAVPVQITAGTAVSNTVTIAVQ